MRFFKLASEPYWSFSSTRVWEVVSVALCITLVIDLLITPQGRYILICRTFNVL